MREEELEPTIEEIPMSCLSKCVRKEGNDEEKKEISLRCRKLVI